MQSHKKCSLACVCNICTMRKKDPSFPLHHQQGEIHSCAHALGRTREKDTQNHSWIFLGTAYCRQHQILACHQNWHSWSSCHLKHNMWACCALALGFCLYCWGWPVSLMNISYLLSKHVQKSTANCAQLYFCPQTSNCASSIVYFFNLWIFPSCSLLLSASVQHSPNKS